MLSNANSPCLSSLFCWVEKPFGYVWIVSQVLPLGSSYLAYSPGCWPLCTCGSYRWHKGGLRNMFRTLNKNAMVHRQHQLLMIESNWMTLEISTFSSQYSASYPVLIPTLFGRRSTPKSGTRFGFGSMNSSANPLDCMDFYGGIACQCDFTLHNILSGVWTSYCTDLFFSFFSS